MDRYLSAPVLKDLQRKPVLLSGPRQCGKTYLSKSINKNSFDYLNFDIPEDRLRLIKREWFRNRDLVIFDEIHKMKNWKSWLKGIFDSEKEKQKFLVTGSAKLNIFKKAGDSLAGRYFSHRLYPFDLKEVVQNIHHPELNFLKIVNKNSSKEILNRLLITSGFPEPFLTNEDGFHNRWRQTHLDVILRQDILETESIKNIKQLETLTHLLSERVGSLLSYNSLKEDLQTDDKSIKRWVDILENAYILFRLYPYVTKSMSSAIRKAPKIYFYDYCRIENSAHRFENLVAFSILKEIHFRLDTKGEVFDLHYVRNKQQKEIDFLITKNKKPHLLIEVKESDSNPSENFKIFDKFFPNILKVQIVKNLDEVRQTKAGIHIVPAHQWLAEMKF